MKEAIDLHSIGSEWMNKAWPRAKFTCFEGDEGMQTELSYSGSLGSVETLWVGSLFGLSGKDFTIINLHRSFNVTPAQDNPYYQSTLAQKDALQKQIRETLGGIGANVNDLELVKNDIRKLKEFKSYFKKAEEGNDLPLKTMFITEVDFYAGGQANIQGQTGRLSIEFQRINNFMPTVVEDFNEIKPKKYFENIKEDYLDKENRFKNISTVEKNFLAAKWESYQEWIKMLKTRINNDYKLMKIQEKSRKSTINMMREDIKPLIARYKIKKDSLSDPENRKNLLTNWTDTEKRINSSENIEVFAIKTMDSTEFHKAPSEMVVKADVKANDKWTQEVLLYGKKDKNGVLTQPGYLKKTYPWIDEKWINDKIKNISDLSGINPEKSMYWTVYKISYKRSNLTLLGTPSEDGDFSFKTFMLSKNMLLAKLLDIEANKENFEYEIDEIVGTSTRQEGTIKYKIQKKDNSTKYIVSEQTIETTGEDIYAGTYTSEENMKDEYGSEYDYIETKQEKTKKKLELLKYFNIPFFFTRPTGPYESRFKDRITKMYLGVVGKRFSVEVVGTFKGNMKIGG
ncbi:MAG: hypothetical protein K0B02_04600 [DPANN group archaeon]|nr:hypothetical protein [DPANN group archaeon]